MSLLFPFGSSAPSSTPVVQTPSGGLTFVQLWNDHLDIELASSDTTQLFTAARRKDAINGAQNTFTRMTGCTKRYAQIDIINGQAEYDLEAEISDYIRLAGPPSIKVVTGSVTRYIQGPENFPRRDVEELDRSDFNWRAASNGTPAFWYLREDGGSTYLGMNAGPSTGSDTWSWLVPYVADPPLMVADTDEPFSFAGNTIRRLSPYVQALVHWAAAQLEPLRKNYSGVTRQMQLYSGYVAQYKQDERVGGRDQITTLRDYYGESHRSRPPDPHSWP